MRKACFLFCFLLAFSALAVTPSSQAQVAVGISVHIGPPPLRVYAQPICPGPDYMWTPGYWAYGDAGYYWVPGAWVIAPRPGFLWTPGYWGFAGGAYLWHAGYWGPHVGFYGGINYGFGYGGVGFGGGEWRGGHFFYNTAVTHVNVNIHNTYVNRTVIVHNNSHVAFNGEGGVRAVPTHEEMAAEHEHHFEATHEQIAHRDMAASNRDGRDERADRREDRAADRRENRNAEDRQARNAENRENRQQAREQKQQSHQKNHPDKPQKEDRRGDHPHR